MGGGQELFVLMNTVLDDEDGGEVLVDVCVVGRGEDGADLRSHGPTPAEILKPIENALVSADHCF